MSTQAPQGPPTGAVIELAQAGNAVERLISLTALTSALEANDGSSAELAELRRLQAAIVPEAERQGRALLAFFEAHGDALDALVAQKAAGGHRLASRVRDHFSATGVTRAGVLLEKLAGEDGLRDDDGVCAALDALVMQEDVKCILGSDLHCALGAQWFQLSLESGCA
jgi:hypothetical protein